MIKLFASDLDGTLLPRNHRFDALIVAGIEKLVHNGRYFTISTGRDCNMSDLTDIEGIIYKICLNGAVITDPEKKILKMSTIDKSVLKEMLETFDDLDLEFITPFKTYTKQSSKSFFEKMKNMPLRDGDDIDVSKMFMERAAQRMVFESSNEEILKQDVCKINSHLQPGRSYNRLYKFLEKHSGEIVNAPCDKNLIEITGFGVNKGNAVHWLGEYLNVTDDEIAVYGDGGNDLQMLSKFDNSYAPNTALDEAKYAANYQLGPYYEYSVIRHMLETLRSDTLSK